MKDSLQSNGEDVPRMIINIFTMHISSFNAATGQQQFIILDGEVTTLQSVTKINCLILVCFVHFTPRYPSELVQQNAYLHGFILYFGEVNLAG